MKTVLFIDEREEGLWSSFLKYDFLLDGFRSRGDFVVCQWNRNATSVSGAIPGLAGLVAPEAEWQAVIVTDLRRPNSELEQDVHFDNPFDFQENYGRTVRDAFEESQEPLVRLAQMLGGLPEKLYADWKIDEEGRLNEFHLEYNFGDDPYGMLERYRLGMRRPTRIICVTPRDRDEAFFEKRRIDLEKNPTVEAVDFWQRNSYPSTARFVLVDRREVAVPATGADGAAAAAQPLSEHQLPSADATARALKGDAHKPDEHKLPDETASSVLAQQRDWFRFWMCVLTLMVGNVKASDLRAYTVYTMDLTIDDAALVDMLSRRRMMWTTARKSIAPLEAVECGKLQSSEYVQDKMPDWNVQVPVSFGKMAGKTPSCDPDVVGFYRDAPEEDLGAWSAQKRRVTDELLEILRTPRRAIRDAVTAFRGWGPLSAEELEYAILSEQQTENLLDALEDQEQELAWGVQRSFYEPDDLQGELKETAAAVEKSIPRRANQRQALRVLGASVASLIVGFLPYYLGLYEEEGASPDALVVTLVSCAVVLAVWVCAMRSMQDRVKAGYRGFNQAIKDALRTLGLGSERLGRRLSLYASFRRGWSLYDRQLHKDVPTHELRRLRYYDALLKTRIRDIDEIARGCHAHMTERTEASSYSREKLDQLLEDESFYNVGTSSRRRSVAEGAEASPAVPFGFISAVGFEPVKML